MYFWIMLTLDVINMMRSSESSMNFELVLQVLNSFYHCRLL